MKEKGPSEIERALRAKDILRTELVPFASVEGVLTAHDENNRLVIKVIVAKGFDGSVVPKEKDGFSVIVVFRDSLALHDNDE
ncbi:MAG: hypothetical protein WC797_00830 [Candidatus Paceibacterota bacterium]|jgi:hypothetical protein